MSRSYRKNWILTDTYGSKYRKWAKRQANKRIRKTENVQDGRWFRKLYDSWNICDYKYHYENGYNRRGSDVTWVKGYSYGDSDYLYLSSFWEYRNK
jgi:hypothetical protein